VYEHIPDGVGRLLDAGCHDGESTAAFHRRAETAFGVDTDDRAIRAGATRFPDVRLLVASGDALPFSDDTFDCVVFSEVLEHVPAEVEERCIRELWRVCRPGGRLILTTPHRGSFWWMDPLMQKTHLRRLVSLLGGKHRQLKGHKHYRLEEIQALLYPCFEIKSIDRVGWLLYPLAYWGYLLPLGLGRSRLLVRLWQGMMDRDYVREKGNRAYSVCITAVPILK